MEYAGLKSRDLESLTEVEQNDLKTKLEMEETK